MNFRILIIEDDIEINQLVVKYLSKEGFDLFKKLKPKVSLQI